MSEIMKIFLTSGLTIFGGVVVYALSQIFSLAILEPIYEQKKTIAQISDVLIFYANKFNSYTSPDQKADEAVEKIRSLSTQLKAKTNFIPLYGLLERCNILIIKSDIEDACHSLIGLSNCIYFQQNGWTNVQTFKKNVSDKLKIDIR